MTAKASADADPDRPLSSGERADATNAADAGLDELGGATIDLGRAKPTPTDTAAVTDTMAGPTLSPAAARSNISSAGEPAAAAAKRAGETAELDSKRATEIRQTIKTEGKSQHSQIFGTYGTVIRTRQLKMADEAAPVDADYEILDQLGEGGMGIVYRAKQCSMNREVAIKRIKGSRHDAGTRAKFLMEAAVTGELAHPNIVPIHDLGTNEQGDLFYAMKVVVGDSWLEVQPRKSREENVDILLRVADAVAFAHSHDIVHRDLKPENVMLGRFGEVLVMDWGLAGKLQPGVKLPSGGSPGYLAPEMAVDLLAAMNIDTGGQPMRPVGKHSDIYLLGAMLFEIVTGQPPHFSSGPQTALYCVQRAARNEFFETDIQGDELLAIAYRAMATNIEDRFSSVEEFQTALREYQDHAQSILLATRAEQNLELAKVRRDYETLAKAQYGFQDAIELWRDNQRATTGLAAAKLAFAETAYRNQDYDLGMSLLDREQPEQRKWHDRLMKARKARDARRTRLRLATLMAIVLLVAACGAAVLFGLKQQQVAEQQKTLAQQQKQLAERQQELANQKTLLAEEQDRRRIAAENAAVAAKNAAASDRQAKIAAEKAAAADRNAKIAAENAANFERKAKEAATYGKFVSDIALADARIHANDPGRAFEILESIREPEANDRAIRDWEWNYLHYLCHREVPHFDVGGSDPVLAVTADADRCVTVARDTLAKRVRARLWRFGKADFESEQVFPFEGMTAQPTAVAISRDGRWVFIGLRGQKTSLLVWDTTSGNTTGLAIHNTDVRSLAYSDEQNWLVTAGRKQYDGDSVAVRLWKVEDAQLREVYLHGLLPNQRPKSDGHNLANVDQLRMDRSGLRIAELNDQSELLIRRLDSAGNTLSVSRNRLKVPEAVVAVFLPESSKRLLIAASNRLLLAQVDESGEVTLEENTEVSSPHTLPILDADVSPDGKTLVTASADRTLAVWNLDQLSAKQQILRGHEAEVVSCRFASRQGEDVVTSVDAAGTTRRWLPHEYLDQVNSEESQVNYLVGNVSEQGDYYALGQTLGRVAIRGRTDDVLGSISIGHERPRELRAFFSSAMNGLVTAASDGSLWTWTADGKPLKQLAAPSTRPISTDTDVAVSPDGTYFVRRADKQYDVWQLDSDRHFAVTPPGNPNTKKTIVDSAGNLVLMVGGDGVRYQLLKVDAQASAPSKRLVGSESFSAYHFVGVRGSDQAVVAMNDGEIKIWTDEQTLPRSFSHSFKDKLAGVDFARDTLLVKLNSSPGVWLADTKQDVDTWGKLTPPESLATTDFQDACLDLAGKTVYLLGSDHGVQAWDLTKNSVSASNALQLNSVNGKWKLAGAGANNVITFSAAGDARIWDFSQGKELVRCVSGPDVTDVYFLGQHPESKRRCLLTFSSDRVLRVWDVELVLQGKSTTPELVSQEFNQPNRDFHMISAGPHPWHVLAVQATQPDSAEIVELDLLTGISESIAVMEVPAAALVSLAWAGDVVVVATAEGEVHSFVRSTRREMPTLKTGDAIQLVRLSPAGAKLAVVTSTPAATVHALSADGVWQTTGVEIKTSDKLAREITAIAFSHSGRRLVVADRGGNIGLWQVDTDKQTQRELMSLSGHKRPIRSLRFSADGRTLLSCDQRNLIVRFTSGW